MWSSPCRISLWESGPFGTSADLVGLQLNLRDLKTKLRGETKSLQRVHKCFMRPLLSKTGFDGVRMEPSYNFPARHLQRSSLTALARFREQIRVKGSGIGIRNSP